MGRFFNPDNSAFQVALNSEIYVDKTGLIEYTNRVLCTKQAFICNSRPRRFGKSMAVDMLTAYYSKGARSAAMFDKLAISQSAAYKQQLNQYDVICIDVQWFWRVIGDSAKLIAYINAEVVKEMRAAYPEVELSKDANISQAMSAINAATGNKFVVLIDEWDVLIRDELDKPEVQEAYINFLRGLFKGVEPTRYIALAYLTGILPIKVEKTQSALNNFDEYTMIEPKAFAPYIGFTEAEVKQLCERYNSSYETVKLWYDGYLLGDYQVYNPNAVVSVMLWSIFQSYWSKTGSYEMIVPLINMDFDGLRSSIIEMLAGSPVPVDTHSFQNDMVTFNSKDDVLTLLIHLGYLGYNQAEGAAFIPNEEIRSELVYSVRDSKWNEMLAFQRDSAALLNATLDMEAAEVAAYIEKIHRDYVSVIKYNDENSLSSVLSLAYLSAMQYYFKLIRELPTGRGFADFVLLPKLQFANRYPALVVELKWNKRAQAALEQIREKQYPESLVQYAGEILLVGISYDKKTKEHQCIIEQMEK